MLNVLSVLRMLSLASACERLLTWTQRMTRTMRKRQSAAGLGRMHGAATLERAQQRLTAAAAMKARNVRVRRRRRHARGVVARITTGTPAVTTSDGGL